MKDPRTILPHLAAMNDGTLNDMVGRARLTPKQDHAIREFVRKARTEPAPGGGGNRNIASTVPACYMRPEEAGKRAGGLPNIDNSSQMATFLSQAKEGGRMMFYDRGAVPRTWLSGSINGTTPRLLTNRNATNPFMMDRMGYHSDGAREHPWLHTAGLDSSPNGTADKFIIPPTGGPMMRLGQRTRGNSPSYFGTSTNVNGPNMGWVYNPGTTFGEVLKVSGVAFEIRLRRKTASGWQMDVLRPFGSPQELADGIRRVCGQTGAPSGCGQLNGAAEQIQAGTARLTNRSEFINAQAFQTRRDPLRLSKTAAEATQPTAMLQELPDLPPDVVKALLTTTPFKSVMNRPWIAGPPASWAPTTKSNFNIVPKNYFAGFIPLTQDACMKCHDSTGRHVDNFDPLPSQMFAPLPTDAQRPRTWYDHLPGDDGILSFHPFDANSVAQGAAATRGAINQCLLRNGLAQ